MPKPYGSAPPLGAAQPIVDDVKNGIGSMIDKGKNFMSHPLDSIKGMLGMPADGAPTGAPTHDQEVQKMNQDMNAHKNDAANASFLPRRAVPKMK